MGLHALQNDHLLKIITRIPTNFLLVSDLKYCPISSGVLQELGYINEDKVVQLKGKSYRPNQHIEPEVAAPPHTVALQRALTTVRPPIGSCF